MTEIIQHFAVHAGLQYPVKKTGALLALNPDMFYSKHYSTCLIIFKFSLEKTV